MPPIKEMAPPPLDFSYNWTSELIASGARFDAAMDLGGGTVVIGARTTGGGDVYISKNYGTPESYEYVTNLGGDISNMGVGGGYGYVLLGSSEVFRTVDGLTYTSLGVASSSTGTLIFKSYSIAITPLGTLLVCDTKTDGGHIWRKSGEGAWSDQGKVGTGSHYRLQVVGDGVLVITFDGKVYKSTDDGVTWTLVATLTAASLFAIEYLGDGIVLICDADGKMWRSINNGATWGMVGQMDGSADDIAYIGDGLVLYASYTSRKDVYFSMDYGKSWRSLGPIITTVGDIWEHIIPLTLANGQRACVGGTNLGYASRLVVN